MASITERGGRFTARVRRKGYALAAKTFTRRSDAQSWARQVEVSMERGDWVEPSDVVPSLKEAITEYRKAVGDKLKGATTYVYRWEEVSALAFASKLVNEVTARDLAQWRDSELSKGLKPSTVVRKLALVSSVLTWCMKERGWLSGGNPASLVSRPKVADARSRTLSADEMSYLTNAATTSKATWLAPALIVLTQSAMRRGELAMLQCADVDFVACTAHLSDTKAGVARDVPLCPKAVAALQALVGAAKVRGDARLIPVDAVGSLSTRFKVTVGRARRAYEQDCAKANTAPAPCFLADLRLHDIRHHAVTAWAATGELDLFALMAVSGHSQPKMLARYINLKPSSVAQRLASISANQAAAA
jgi:integrase